MQIEEPFSILPLGTPPASALACSLLGCRSRSSAQLAALLGCL